MWPWPRKLQRKDISVLNINFLETLLYFLFDYYTKIDMANSQALELVREVDPDGDRTIGVVTMLDIMNPGTDAREILTNMSEFKLKRGFIGVVNRSQEEINRRMDMSECLDKEERFFSESPVYSDIAYKQGMFYSVQL